MSSNLLTTLPNVVDLMTAVVMLVLFVVTIGIHVPSHRRWRQFRIAVRMVGFACLLLFGNYLASALLLSRDPGSEQHLLTSLLTVDVATFQAMLFTMISIVLVLPDALRWSHIVRHLILLTAVAIVTIGGYAALPTRREPFVVVSCIFYSGYITYLTLRFRRTFAHAVNHLETTYDEDMLPRLQWVRVFFYGALLVGLAALLTAVFPSSVFDALFTISVPIYYSFAVIRLMNYVVTSAYVVKAAPARVSEESIPSAAEPSAVPAPEPPQPLPSAIFPPITFDNPLFPVREALEAWISACGYAKADATVDEIIDELGVSRQDFLAYFKNVLGIQFRTWRRHLRIEAAMRIIDANPRVTVSEIMESVGYADRSNFHKHFQSVSGVPIKEYREAAMRGETSA